MSFLNLILAVFIVLAIVSYLYLKMKQIRTTLPIRKKWYQYRSGQSLSLFLIIFAINQLVLYQTSTTYIICAILFLFGVVALIGFTKRAKHYAQFVQEEAVLNQ